MITRNDLHAREDVLHTSRTERGQCSRDSARSIVCDGRSAGMGKFAFLLVSAAIGFAAFAVYRNVLDEDAVPETMSEDVWWGPEYSRALDGNAADVRPFKINISNDVRREPRLLSLTSNARARFTKISIRIPCVADH